MSPFRRLFHRLFHWARAEADLDEEIRFYLDHQLFALLLACLGLYGVLAHGVRRRTKEFAVRIAVGASASDVQRLVARETMWTLVAGLLLGAILAVSTGRVAASLLFGISPYDGATLLVAAGTIVLAGALATWVPARNAGRADPASALRDQ